METERRENNSLSLPFAIISILIQCSSYQKEFLFGFYVDSSVPFRDKSAKAGVQNGLEVHWAAYSLPLLENCETPELNSVSTACFPVETTHAFTVAEPIVRKILSNSLFSYYMPQIKVLWK